jgi:hypothetical protein
MSKWNEQQERWMLRRLLVVGAIAVLGGGCEFPADAQFQANVLRWGTSFGMCAGYCKQELAIASTSLQLTRTSWSPQQNPPVVQEQAFTDADWRRLLERVDGDRIRLLNEVYGCPDCADGGAEWIEVETPTFKKKITFEYNKPPAELKGQLRHALRGRFPE